MPSRSDDTWSQSRVRQFPPPAGAHAAHVPGPPNAAPPREALRALMAWHPEGSGLMCASPSLSCPLRVPAWTRVCPTIFVDRTVTLCCVGRTSASPSPRLRVRRISARAGPARFAARPGRPGPVHRPGSSPPPASPTHASLGSFPPKRTLRVHSGRFAAA